MKRGHRSEPSDFVMARKRATPEEDLNRMSENLWSNYGDMIVDQVSFEKAYKDYFQTDFVPKLKDKKIRGSVWDHILDNHKSRIKPEDRIPLRSQAKAMKTAQDKAKEPVKQNIVSGKEFLRLALSGENMNQFIASKKFEFLGRQKAYTAKRSKTTFARIINTKRGIRFIDSRGRYVSVKK